MRKAFARRGNERVPDNIEPCGDSLRIRVYVVIDPVTGPSRSCLT